MTIALPALNRAPRRRARFGLIACVHAIALSIGLLGAASAQAAGTVTFTSPPDGSSYPVATTVAPTGNANITGVSGDGLDLVLVLDSSGSMGTSIGGKTLRQWQAEAAKALINSLPTVGVSVSIVEFDSSASTVRTLTALTPASNIALLEAAIDTVNASGGTNIGTGIDAATAELLANGTAGRSQQMLVLSDGYSGGDPVGRAAAAIAAGVDAVNTVGLPGADIATMQAIASAGNGTFTDVTSSVQDLIDLFAGSGGSLVGVSSVEITDPDGNSYTVAVDALGNFTVDPYALKLGGNTWNALATFTDGSTASATLTLNGLASGGGTTPSAVPLPGGFPLLLGAIGGMGLFGRRRRKT